MMDEGDAGAVWRGNAREAAVSLSMAEQGEHELSDLKSEGRQGIIPLGGWRDPLPTSPLHFAYLRWALVSTRT